MVARQHPHSSVFIQYMTYSLKGNRSLNSTYCLSSVKLLTHLLLTHLLYCGPQLYPGRGRRVGKGRRGRRERGGGRGRRVSRGERGKREERGGEGRETYYLTLNTFNVTSTGSQCVSATSCDGECCLNMCMCST